MKRALCLTALAALFAACTDNTPPPTTPAPPPPSGSVAADAAQAPPKLDAVPRLEWNRIAQDLNLPLFWIADKNGSGAIDPDELGVLWGVPSKAAWTEGGAFSPAFFEAYRAIAKVKAEGFQTAGLSDAEKKRRAAVLADLAQGRPSIVRSSLQGASAEDKALVEHVMRAAEIIETIYAKQRGTFGMEAEIAADDTASRALFHRNQGPWCEGAKTEKDADCSALARKPGKVSGLYPAKIQTDGKWCEKLEARKDQKELLYQFAVVVEEGSDLKAVPYNVAYKAEMTAVSAELKAAADAIQSAGEAPLKAYLAAASQSFLTNDWNPADEAWAKMNVNNSKWYLRIGPDETYFEPCNHKAGFHVSFARINQDSVKWQKMLDPRKADMEAQLAKLAGAPYKARSVTFHLPDFIDIVLNAGDSRNAFGATIGQSLPNWGPVANDGRGRTVAMTNLYTDKDSEAGFMSAMEALYCSSAMEWVTFDPAVLTMSTVLHEASHNLGPAHEYKVKGKKDTEVFGGGLASTFEELKAQTAALYFIDWLVQEKLVDRKTASLSHIRDISWAFGHISSGMYTSDDKPKPYSQLASIQVGALMDAGAIVWKADEMAKNGKDKGCFAVHMDKFPPAIVELSKKVLGIKGRGDKAGAIKLREQYVDKDGPWKQLREVITERMNRSPRASFVYSIDR